MKLKYLSLGTRILLNKYYATHYNTSIMIVLSLELSATLHILLPPFNQQSLSRDHRPPQTEGHFRRLIDCRKILNVPAHKNNNVGCFEGTNGCNYRIPGTHFSAKLLKKAFCDSQH